MNWSEEDLQRYLANRPDVGASEYVRPTAPSSECRVTLVTRSQTSDKGRGRRIGPSDAPDAPSDDKPSKWHNKKTKGSDGIIYHSKKEAKFAEYLVALERTGQITDLERQPTFVLLEGFRDRRGKWHRPISYRADFAFVQDGKKVVVDVKGAKTEVFRIKEKLFRSKFPETDFRLE